MKIRNLFLSVLFVLLLGMTLAMADDPSVNVNVGSSSVSVGDTASISWTISGGKAPYKVEVEWIVQESCLKKIIKTETSTTVTGTSTYTVPSGPDQIMPRVTVTDADGNTDRIQSWMQINNYQHNNPTSFSISADQDYVTVGDTVFSSWKIDAGRHTISKVQYCWIERTRNSQGNWNWSDPAWTDAGTSLTGSVSYKTTKAGFTFLQLAIEADDGWYADGLIMDQIQVINSGDTPLTATLTMTPAEPKVGDTVEIAWEIFGTGANTDYRLEWYDENGSGQDNNIPAKGNVTINTTTQSDLRYTLFVEDSDLECYLRKQVQAFVEVPSPFDNISFTVSPSKLTIGQPVTVSWKVTGTPSLSSSEMVPRVFFGDMEKTLYFEELQKADFSRNGSVTFTPGEGDTLIIWANVIDTNDNYFEEPVGQYVLQGSWNAPNPIEVNVTYQIKSVSTGQDIIATYQVTGGTGSYDDICGRWVWQGSNGGFRDLHQRDVTATSGTLTESVSQAGYAALVFSVTDSDGWELWQNVPGQGDMVTVTGNSVASTPGIEFYDGVPTSINAQDGNFTITWDVTGISDYFADIDTHIHVETDDGIVLVDDLAVYYLTNYWQVDFDQSQISNSQNVIVTLTPQVNGTAGTTETRTIPIVNPLSFALTAGNPTGHAQNVSFNVQQQVAGKTVYGITWQELDNGYIRFIVDYEMPSGLNVFVFNPPNGDLFGLRGNGTTDSARSEFQVDIAKNDLLSVSGVTINFYDNSDSYFVFFNTDFLTAGTGIAKMGGVFAFDNHQNLNTIPTYYVDSTMPLSNNIATDETDDGKLYSNFVLFTYWISNFNEIQSQLTTAPQFTITCTTGNVNCVQGGDPSGRSMDLYLMSMPQPGLAEFEATCVVEGQTYTQTVKINFEQLPSKPTGITTSYNDPLIVKVGDALNYAPPISFNNGWSVGNRAWSEIHGDQDFWSAVDLQTDTWSTPGIYKMQLVACAGNVEMNRTISAVVTEADGTISSGDYKPFGTIATLPADMKKIESQAFAGTQLTEIDIPAGVDIASDAFDGTGLVSIYCHDQDTINYAIKHGLVPVV